ncbi:uncharacterized protein LOC113870797 [Abrus precatorius]|uniref:Uncharacterized protein LOC113870797 n=1 Tax=Abrus precatorius TaxID=3816 RepID=A0A8B8M515_ABRPR|nr:uncharacterized protein LOC113870797 [Abrus precatorius]
MDSKHSKFHALSGSIAKHVFFRVLFLVSAVSIVSLIRVIPTIDLGSLTPNTYVDCVEDSDSDNVTVTPGSYLFQSRILNTFWGSFDNITCKKHINLTSIVVTELMGQRLLNRGAKSLCLGEGSPMAVSTMQRLGFSSVSGVHKDPFVSFNQRKIVCHLEYNDGSFDFVFSKDVDKVSVPALMVLEVERILKPGGIGALLVSSTDFSATPVSSLLRFSSVVHVGYVNELSLVVFKKRFENENTSSLFYHHGLPADCASVTFTKPLVELMEPLVEERPLLEFEKRISYLPKFVDVSSRKRLVYIDIGVGELMDANVTDWFPPYYPIDQKAFSVYFVHYNASVLLSYVKGPRVTFVYHPGLAQKAEANKGVDRDIDPFLGENEFDFLVWFKETVQYADFVVLKMNAGQVEMKFLRDIFESGAVCYVDEMFLSCSDSGDGISESMNRRKHCMDIYMGLRNNGVYVHQLWDTRLHQEPQVSYVQ